MSLHANPLLFLNLGGEMLYVIQQRLKAQKIESRKAAQVLDDITAALVNPKIIKIIFEKCSLQELGWMRTTLESIALSSIMKLDKESTNKLFDLMMMMVKYQLAGATGPREILLITLNHLDSMRGIITRTNTHEWITLTHRTLIDFYGSLSYEEIWQARNDCLNKLNDINIRVSVLLKLGLQNEDTTFNINPKSYNEKYFERQNELGASKLMENKGNYIGSLSLFGERVTVLGRNMYSVSYDNPPKPRPQINTKEKVFQRDNASKMEIALLAKQLGTENIELSAIPRSFNFDLFIDELVTKPEDSNNSTECVDETNDGNGNKSNGNNHSNKNDSKMQKVQKLDISEYKQKLESMYADFIEDRPIERQLNLLQLLDEAE